MGEIRYWDAVDCWDRVERVRVEWSGVETKFRGLMGDGCEITQTTRMQLTGGMEGNRGMLE